MADFRSRAEKIQSESQDHPTVPSSKSDGVGQKPQGLAWSASTAANMATCEHGKERPSECWSLPETEALNPRWWCLKVGPLAVIRFRWGCKGGALKMGSVLSKKRQTSANQEESARQERNLPGPWPWPWPSLPPDCEKYLLFTPPSLRYSVYSNPRGLRQSNIL